MINVTKTWLPPLEEYNKYLEEIWKRGWVTNNGQLLIELELELKDYLGVKNLEIVSNGTIALLIAIEALEISDEVITTPFSYVATSSSILWQKCTPVFVDIDNKSLGINPENIEVAITEKTTAILATHIYGLPCDIENIQNIAEKYDLKVIYDGAHAFGSKLNGRSLLSYGDITIASFHATKIFHTVEGGAIITDSDNLAEKVHQIKSFGHLYDQYYRVGINGKCSELHAAMGFCLLPRIEEFIKSRKIASRLYKKYLDGLPLVFPEIPDNVEYNYAYFPVIFPSPEQLLKTSRKLLEHRINCRRYFRPSLNTLPFLDGKECPVSEDISERVLCLPLYQDLLPGEIEKISELVISSFQESGTDSNSGQSTKVASQ